MVRSESCNGDRRSHVSHMHQILSFTIARPDEQECRGPAVLGLHSGRGKGSSTEQETVKKFIQKIAFSSVQH